MTVEISYWLKSEDVQNFGDFFSELLLEELFYPIGVPANRIHIIGSVIDDIFMPEPSNTNEPERVVFWGAGVREKLHVSAQSQNLASILSVRGPLSASELRLGAAVPIGDPAFVIPALYAPATRSRFKGRSVCIPHFHDDRTDEEIRNKSGCDIVLRPNLPNDTMELRRFIDAIHTCDFVLAGAMHGAIIAAAYKKEFAYWDSDQIDLPFKWHDLSASLNIPTVFCKDLRAAKKHYNAEIAKAIKLPSLWESLAVSPLLIRPSALLKIAGYEMRDHLSKDARDRFDELTAVLCRDHASGDRIIEDLICRISKDEQTFENQLREIERLQTEYNVRLSESARQLAVLSQSCKSETGDLRRKLFELKTDYNRLADRSEAESLSASDHTTELETLRHQLQDKDDQLLSVYNSTSWKITSPLRRALSRAPQSVRRFLRRFATVVWWAGTLQFGRLATRLSGNKNNLPTHAPAAETKAENAGRSGSYEVSEHSENVADLNLDGADWSKPVVLIIDSVFPRPDKDSGSIDAMNFVKSFRKIGYQVIFVAGHPAPEDSHYKSGLEKMGVHCIAAPEKQTLESFLRTISHMVDLCFLSRVDIGGTYIEMLKRTLDHSRIIFNTVDLHHIREERQARLAGDRVGINKALATREREYAVIALADASIVVSEEEQKTLARERPGALVTMIPLARDCPGRINPYAARSGIGFVGGFQHAPNVDAVLYFLDCIWPLVRVSLPDVNFYVIGADLPENIRQRTDPGLVCVGFVADLTEQLEQLRVTVAPLRFGAGVKGKVASSLAHGVPCVATALAAEGMGLSDGETIAVGRTAEEFSQQIIKLYCDEQQWIRTSDAGIAHISKNYSFDRCHNLLLQLLAEIGAPTTGESSSGAVASKAVSR